MLALSDGLAFPPTLVLPQVGIVQALRRRSGMVPHTSQCVSWDLQVPDLSHNLQSYNGCIPISLFFSYSQ